jgi:glycerophosphoryl diester phosphodiesterase
MSFKYLLLFFFICGCIKADSNFNNLNNGKIGIIGHGGIGFQSEINQLPHNSLKSILKATDGYGADGVEVDIQLSKDGKIILYHDGTLQSMTNCNGCIYELTGEQVTNCRFRNDFFVNLFTQEYLIDLEKLLEEFLKRRKKPELFLDVKLLFECHQDTEGLQNFAARFAKTIVEIIERKNYLQYIKVQSTSIDFLLEVKKQNPLIALIIEGDPETVIETADEHKLWGYISRNDGVSKEAVKRAHEKGLRVVLFGIKTREGTIKAINKHPDYIQTDNIPLLQQCLK